MAQHQVRRLPITENEKLTGIVTLGDLAAKNIYQNDAMVYYDTAGMVLSSISEPADFNGF
ncbi:CBS domain-containing protein [Peptococcaceae bacterium]|nr:CBS domain-containing protein [Peptococcaceae bacterium]